LAWGTKKKVKPGDFGSASKKRRYLGRNVKHQPISTCQIPASGGGKGGKWGRFKGRKQQKRMEKIKAGKGCLGGEKVEEKSPRGGRGGGEDSFKNQTTGKTGVLSNKNVTVEQR